MFAGMSSLDYKTIIQVISAFNLHNFGLYLYRGLFDTFKFPVFERAVLIYA